MLLLKNIGQESKKYGVFCELLVINRLGDIENFRSLVRFPPLRPPTTPLCLQNLDFCQPWPNPGVGNLTMVCILVTSSFQNLVGFSTLYSLL